jgi:hypothetical protein
VPPPVDSPRGLLWRWLGWTVPVENPAGAVYGLIAVGSLMAAESGLRETYLDTLLSAVIAACLYWLLHAYASVLGRRLATGDPLTPSALLRALGHDWALLRGAAVPIAALLVEWAAGASQQTAVTVALWSVVAGLVVFELLAALRIRSTWRELALEVCVGLALGLAIIALRIALH